MDQGCYPFNESETVHILTFIADSHRPGQSSRHTPLLLSSFKNCEHLFTQRFQFNALAGETNAINDHHHHSPVSLSLPLSSSSSITPTTIIHLTFSYYPIHTCTY